MEPRASGSRKQRRAKHARNPCAAALAATFILVIGHVEARGFGGGIRGGGAMSVSRGGSFSHGSAGRGSFDRGSAGFSSGGTFSRAGEYGRPTTRPGQGGAGTQIGGRDLKPATRPGGGGSGTQIGGGDSKPSRPGQGGSGTQWQPDNRPDHNCPGCGGSGERWDGWDGWVDHPIAAGVAIGAARAAAIGSVYQALPPGCAPYYWSGYNYYSCGGVYYQPEFQGETVVYIVVPDPSAAQGSSPEH